MPPGDVYQALVREAEADGVQQLVVGAVIEDHGRVLILQRPATDFMGGIRELPSGKVEPGEALDQALRREVLEETWPCDHRRPQLPRQLRLPGRQRQTEPAA